MRSQRLPPGFASLHHGGRESDGIAEQMTLHEVSQRIGLTEQGVHMAEKRAVRKLWRNPISLASTRRS